MRVRLVPDQTQETTCHALVDAFEYFGGVPLLAVFDNPRTLVAKREGKHVRWHDTFAWFSTESGFSPHATWPRRPQEKGAVESLVGFVKSSFFKAHRFRDRAELEAKLAEWHRWVNDELRSRATGEIPRVRFLLEAQRLLRPSDPQSPEPPPALPQRACCTPRGARVSGTRTVRLSGTDRGQRPLRTRGGCRTRRTRHIQLPHATCSPA
jgi:hypothetical protein